MGKYDKWLAWAPEWWHKLLRTGLYLLKKDGYDIDKITYIKEKYGTMSVECSGRHDIISDMETASSFFCQECGQIWYTRFDLWWFQTLCDFHYEQKKHENSSIEQR